MAERALADFGLVRRVGRVELTAQQHMVDDRRDEVMVRARAPEDGVILAVIVGFTQRHQFGGHFHLAQRRWHIERGETVRRRDGLEQILNRGDADGRQHLLTFNIGMYIAHVIDSHNMRRRLSHPSGRPRRASVTLIRQPLPNGSC
jgi:hypothetical protein